MRGRPIRIPAPVAAVPTDPEERQRWADRLVDEYCDRHGFMRSNDATVSPGGDGEVHVTFGVFEVD